ncbi:M24 family metallopeptidase [Falsiroseomonas sp. HW251]|uniref:M24 family metallopeptidase n=1 Tax=Falsiroseomonas sp. HW251 TaxID=3390998 RepID=UPI003D316774
MQFRPDVERLGALPGERGLDAIIAMSPENFAYVSGCFILTVGLIRPRQAFAIVPARGKPSLVICSIELSLAESDSWIEDIATYTEFADSPIDALVKELKVKGLEKGRLGLDLDYIPASSFDRLKAALPQASFVNTTEDIAGIRAIKTPAEVAHLEKITKQTHRAVLDAMAASNQGDTERNMADRIATNIITNGADGTLFVCFASGDRTPQAHAHANDRVPRPGEIIRFDVGGTYGAWASDFARTYSSGNPSPMQKDTYAKLWKVHKATIDMVKPGVTAEEIFFFCKDQFAKQGLEFHMPHVGHSFGVELHENPMLRPGDKTVMREGLVINIEPVAKDAEGSLYHIEDLIVVTADGHRVLTLGLPPPELPVIGRTLDY